MIRFINALAVIVAFVTAVGVYKAKTEAKAAQAEVAELQEELEDQAQALRVLENEVAVLERPERLGRLAKEKLGFELIDPLRVVTVEDAPLFLEPAPALASAAPLAASPAPISVPAAIPASEAIKVGGVEISIWSWASECAFHLRRVCHDGGVSGPGCSNRTARIDGGGHGCLDQRASPRGTRPASRHC